MSIDRGETRAARVTRRLTGTMQTVFGCLIAVALAVLVAFDHARRLPRAAWVVFALYSVAVFATTFLAGFCAGRMKLEEVVDP